jgi:hypothetical protein
MGLYTVLAYVDFAATHEFLGVSGPCDTLCGCNVI